MQNKTRSHRLVETLCLQMVRLLVHNDRKGVEIPSVPPCEPPSYMNVVHCTWTVCGVHGDFNRLTLSTGCLNVEFTLL